MSVLVTGGAGFIGSNIVDMLLERGYDVVVIDNLSTGKKENIHKKATFDLADITKKTQLQKIFEKEDITVVIHQAAQVDVRKSIEDPCFDAKTNILGSLNLLEVAVENGVEKFIYASSGGAVYGEPENLPVNENHPIHPLSPYGESKYTVERYLDVYKALHGLRSVSLRYGNVYGPRQDPFGEAGVIAIFASKILRGERPVIFGDGEQSRDYVYVGDVVEANMSALEKNVEGVFNIGTEKQTSVNDIKTTLLKELQSDIKPTYEKPIKGEVRHISLDISKAKKELGWRPKVHLDEGISKYIEWLKKTSGR
jgi:UDP-glucose 4-epimerase